MIFFDIGANSGDAVLSGLQKGYKVIALEPAPRVFKNLISNFIYNTNVIPLKFAVSDCDNSLIEFYECVEDGLSTIEKSWLTDDSMPYKGKEFRTIKATTITIDSLVKIYGIPNLIKIDVEGAEWFVFRGMTKYYGKLTFEWTINTIDEHQKQIDYLKSLGYTKIGPQFIEHHLQEPVEWFDIESFNFNKWISNNSDDWINNEWKKSNLRPTADVGMCWII
jgi:FkbM family methyltransferase